MKVIFVTGNDEKIRDAQFALKPFGIEIAKETLEIDEIQHHEPINIALAKAESAYSQLGQPLVINDSSWSIPALNGFPGGYMKDVAAWFTSRDWLTLMKGNADRRIFLHEVVVYIDDSSPQIFETLREGEFVDTPAGNNGPSFSRLVKMEGDDITISQIFDKSGERELNPERYEHWNKFGEWFKGKND